MIRSKKNFVTDEANHTHLSILKIDFQHIFSINFETVGRIEIGR